MYIRASSFWRKSVSLNNKPKMVNAREGLNKVILRKIKRFDCKINQVLSKQLASCSTRLGFSLIGYYI